MTSLTTDVVVVGAGAAGLLAAVAARRLGHEVVLVEASNLVGGITATGDGRIWLPANDVPGHGPDPIDDARTYLTETVGVGDPLVEARRDAFTRTAGILARWLVSSRIGLQVVKGLPDCQPSATGARDQGRTLAPKPFIRMALDAWADRVRGAAIPGGNKRQPGRVGWLGRILGRQETPLTGGAALIAELLRRATASGVEIWLETPVTEVVLDGDAVVGVRAVRDSEAVELRASRGVILASGGFGSDAALRDDHLPLPTDISWTLAGETSPGTSLHIADQIGAAVDGLAEAWWTPVMLVDGVAYSVDDARTLPHGLIVDQAGDRFFNEAEPALTAGRRLYDRNRGMRAIPSFLIVDNRHRKNYPLGPWPAGSSPRSALDSGDLVKANTLVNLAKALGVDRAGLIGSVVAFNGSGGKGKDVDFKRGQSPYDLFRGAPGKRSNVVLGKVDKGPYWAVRLYPGDRGTKGGLVVDENGRVQRTEGGPIPGLWACGGAAVSLMGRGEPGEGAALGEALVGAYRAVLDLSDQVGRIDEAALEHARHPAPTDVDPHPAEA